MRRYVYRIAQVEWNDKTDRGLQIADALNDFAREGWRVVTMDISPVRRSSGKSIDVLLERRAKKGEASEISVKNSPEPPKKAKAAKTRASERTAKSRANKP